MQVCNKNFGQRDFNIARLCRWQGRLLYSLPMAWTPTRRPPLAGSDSARAARAAASLSRPNGSSVQYDEAQQRVIDCQDAIVVAEAFAGAGKTTTAVGFTEARPKTRFLYLCFNRANAQEARQRFGPHVECRTGHSLAWATVGHKYSGQLASGGWRARQLALETNVRDIRAAALAQSILMSFFSSADKALDAQHTLDARQQYNATEPELARAMDIARMAWSAMKTPGKKISVPHDCYLKVWALSDPRLPYEHIILDEAQDTNPVMVDVMRRQTHAKMLLIGDRHQSIYGFRGAYNAMELFSAMGATVLKIPRTWRFGQKIADIANALLSHFKGEETAIIGAGPTKAATPRAPRTILSRTNAGLFKEAAEVAGQGIFWVGGIEGYRVDLLLDAWRLKCGDRQAIVSPDLRQYTSWQQFIDEAEMTQSAESRLLCRLVEAYNQDIPGLVQTLKRNALPSERGAHLVLATAHKSKGLDFDHVVIGEDFECLNKAQVALVDTPGEPLEETLKQEINLLYVAITRARHRLTLNKETQEFLNRIDDYRAALQEAAGNAALNSNLSAPVPS